MTAALRLRVLPRFPARITGTDGVKVTRANGSPDVSVSLDFASLGDVEGIPDPTTNFFAVYDQETGAYYRVPFQSMFDAAGMVPGYATRVAAELAVVPTPTRAILLLGDAAVGDGEGGLYIDTDNGSSDTFVSAGPTSRTWYRAADVGNSRLVDGATGDYPTQALFEAANIPAVRSRVSVGTGKIRHDKVRIATPSPVELWHSQSADGAWWEIDTPAVYMEMLGTPGTGAQNKVLFDNAAKYASLKGARFVIGSDIGIDGAAETRSNVIFEWDGGGLLRQTKRSVVGAFMTNVTLIAADREQTDITLRNPQISGEDYPDPIILEVASATTSTITFTSSASTVDDFYNRLTIQCMDGALANSTGTGLIIDYDGATRTATFPDRALGVPAFPTAPAAGVDVQVGYNDNAFGTAWGGKRIRVEGGHLRDYPMSKMTPPVLGGKGCNFEQGNDDVSIDGTTVTNCNTAVYISGHDGDLTTGASKRVVGARVYNVHGELCSSYLTIGNLDLEAGIPADVDQLQTIVEGGTYHNCGHAPYRIVGTSQEKSGIINLMGANGATVGNIRGYNDPDVVTKLGGYLSDYTARCSYGLSGPPGAVVWGHARNSTLYEIHHGGDVDAAIHVGRVRALGDDAPGNVSEMFGWKILNLHVYGSVSRIVSRDENIGLDATQFKDCYFQVTVDAVTDVFIPPQFTTATGLILDITRRTDGTRIIGRASDILKRGNTFADYTAGEFYDLRVKDRRQWVMADDTAVSFTPLAVNGNFSLRTTANLGNNIVRYEADASPQCTLYLTTGQQASAVTPLTGTTGTDGNFTVAAYSDGKIYLENRRGGALTVEVAFL